MNDYSASNINKERRHYYDSFNIPCGARNAYIPNARCRSLLASYKAILDNNPESKLICGTLCCALNRHNSFPYKEGGGSETKLNDPNLNIIFNQIAASISRKSTDGAYTFSKESIRFKTLLASNTSLGEYIFYYKNVPLIGSECKGAEFSSFFGLPQCFQVYV